MQKLNEKIDEEFEEFEKSIIKKDLEIQLERKNKINDLNDKIEKIRKISFSLQKNKKKYSEKNIQINFIKIFETIHKLEEEKDYLTLLEKDYSNELDNKNKLDLLKYFNPKKYNDILKKKNEFNDIIDYQSSIRGFQLFENSDTRDKLLKELKEEYLQKSNYEELKEYI